MAEQVPTPHRIGSPVEVRSSLSKHGPVHVSVEPDTTINDVIAEAVVWLDLMDRTPLIYATHDGTRLAPSDLAWGRGELRLWVELNG